MGYSRSTKVAKDPRCVFYSRKREEHRPQ